MAEDDRFDEFKTNPKYRKVQRTKGTRVSIDSRFSKALKTDDGFNLKWKHDRRGRPVNFTQQENFDRFYQSKKEKLEILDSDQDDDKEVDRIRGIGISESSESESDSEDENLVDSKSDLYDTNKAQVVRTEDISRRLAIQNMDWDRVNAADIFVLMKSSCPPNGSVLNVSIYPSQFGKERIAIEEKHGPRLADTNENLDEEEKLRLYQLERLKYYYAVVETSDDTTADTIYVDLDNQAYGESGVSLDIRFIPDEISFDTDTPRLTKTYRAPDVCTEVPRNYEVPDFVTSALTRTKVNLTWDETDRRRTTLLRKGDFAEDQVSHLIASGSDTDDENDNEENKKIAQKWREKFSGLLDGGENSQEKGDESSDESDVETDEEIVFNDEETNDKNVEFKIESNNVDDGSDNLISDDEMDNTSRKKKRKENIEPTSDDEKNTAELDLIMFDPEDELSGRKHFDVREEEKEKKERKKKLKRKPKEISEGADLSDTRFTGRLIEDDEFAVDRTNPSYKPSKAMDDLHQRRNKRNKPEDHLLPPSEVKSIAPKQPEKKRTRDDNDDIVRRLKMRSNK